MTKQLNITVIKDDKEMSLEEIKKLEQERTLHVIDELANLGADLLLEGQVISKEEAQNKAFEAQSAIVRESKIALGDDALLALYVDKIKTSDALWREISNNSTDRQNLKRAVIDMKIEGLTVQEFLGFNAQLNATGNSTSAFAINPEHYYFHAENGSQYVLEAFGQYGEPVFFKLDHLSPEEFACIEVDADATFAMGCVFYLKSDLTPMKAYGLHQFKAREYGFDVKLCIAFPEAAPDEMVSGHQEHLMIEFVNAFSLAANAL